MKKKLFIFATLVTLIYFGSCTNHEGDDSLTAITPADSTQSVLK